MTAPRYVVVDLDESAAVVSADGELIAYGTERVASGFKRQLNLYEPTPEALDRVLGRDKDGRGRRTYRGLTLQYDAFCHVCGRVIPAGKQARWNPVTRLVRHARSCPKAKRARAAA